VERFIEDTSDFQGELKKTLSKTVAANKKKSQSITSSDALFALTTINSLSGIIEELGDDIKELKKLFAKDASRIDMLYQETLIIDKNLKRVEEVLNTQQQIIDTVSK
jgi:uncharacterized coiled-coil protein SlyX